jgi:hypothetical protein
MTPERLGLTFDESLMLIPLGVRALAGHQVVSLEAAWTACTRLLPEVMEADDERRLRWLLGQLGYREEWVAAVARSRMARMWVRGPWPRDFWANLRRDVTCYVSAS